MESQHTQHTTESRASSHERATLFVHDHAIRYHRQRRRKNKLTSVLEAIPGVGPARRKALLKHLGSAKAVVRASEADLAAVPGVGPALAAQIYAALH